MNAGQLSIPTTFSNTSKRRLAILMADEQCIQMYISGTYQWGSTIRTNAGQQSFPDLGQ